MPTYQTNILNQTCSFKSLFLNVFFVFFLFFPPSLCQKSLELKLPPRFHFYIKCIYWSRHALPPVTLMVFALLFILAVCHNSVDFHSSKGRLHRLHKLRKKSLLWPKYYNTRYPSNILLHWNQLAMFLGDDFIMKKNPSVANRRASGLQCTILVKWSDKRLCFFSTLCMLIINKKLHM